MSEENLSRFAVPARARRNPASECQSMPDVRYEVDRLDEMLVTLMAERQSYMDAAARIKGDRAAVRDPARIEDVVAKVLVQAKAVGLSTAIAGPVWRTMIDRCIAYEFDAWDRLRATEKSPETASS
jgi:isochorismate pyruvate lyase